MVTIKHVSDEGKETLMDAASTEFDYTSKRLIGRGIPIPTDLTFDSGHVYVMNDAGKTIGIYNLDKKEQKHD